MLFFILEGSVYAYFYVFEPSYMSVVDACGIRNIEEMGYETRGSFTIGSSNESENGIKIYYPEKYDSSWYMRNEYMKTKKYQRIMKHEKIHQWQYEHNLFFGCNHKVLTYLNEVHAYVGMYF